MCFANAELEITKRGATVAYFKLLFNISCSKEQLRKPSRNTSLWPKIRSQMWYFFSLCSPSATLVVDFATMTGFSLRMLEPPPTKPCGTRATRQVGPTAWHNVATKTLCYLENQASAKPVTSGFTDDNANAFSLPRGGARPWLVKCDLWWWLLSIPWTAQERIRRTRE